MGNKTGIVCCLISTAKTALVLLYLTNESWKQVRYEEVPSSNYEMQTLKTNSHFFQCNTSSYWNEASSLSWKSNTLWLHSALCSNVCMLYFWCVFLLLTWHRIYLVIYSPYILLIYCSITPAKHKTIFCLIVLIKHDIDFVLMLDIFLEVIAFTVPAFIFFFVILSVSDPKECSTTVSVFSLSRLCTNDLSRKSLIMSGLRLPC